MANICSNNFYISADSEKTISAISKKLEALFKDQLRGEISYEDDMMIEGYFESRGTFPEYIFNDFFKEFNDDTIYMRCLSEEYGMGIVSMNVYSAETWWEPQYFDF